MGAFKDRLASLKSHQKITAKEIAKFCDVSPVTVFKWLGGRSVPRMQHMAKLAGMLGVTSDYLVHGDQEPKREAAIEKLRAALPNLSTKQIMLIVELSDEFLGKNQPPKFIS